MGPIPFCSDLCLDRRVDHGHRIYGRSTWNYAKEKFRDDCLLLACSSFCDTLDTTRPLAVDTGLIMSRSDASVTDRIYREIVDNRDVGVSKKG